ncbi:MAG: hypothetical protein Q8O67_04950 [Deltaproteobacteria bacterium]|nr:hypothetical protein [Deltaproteobacteria bacterium]
MFTQLVALALLAAVPDLEAAQKAYVDVDYAKCREKSQQALLQPGSLKDRVDGWKLLGLCSAAVGETDAARDAFRMMLAIDKDAKLPEGLSPRFTSSYREAKGSLVGTTPLALTIASEQTDKNSRTVRIKVDDDAGVAAKIAWRGPSGSLSPPVKKSDLVELELPISVDVVVVALDKAAGEVATLSLPARGADNTSPLDEKPKDPPIVEDETPSALPLIIGGVLAGVVVVGAAAGVAVVLFSPPQSVNLRTDVVFAD